MESRNLSVGKSEVIYGLLILMIISGPWFFVPFRSAISLTDVFLFLVCLTVMSNKNDFLSAILSGRSMFIVAVLFAASIVYSLVPLYFSDQVRSFWRAAVTSGQYAFIFFLFPFIARALHQSLTVKAFTRIVAIAYLAPLMVQLFYTFFLKSNSEEFFVAGRALLSYGNANSAAIVISIALPFFIILVLMEKRTLWLSLGLFGVAASSACLLLTGSTSGIILFVCVLTCPRTFIQRQLEPLPFLLRRRARVEQPTRSPYRAKCWSWLR